MLVNRSFGLIKNRQGSKGKVSQEPQLAGGQCSALSRGAGGAATPGSCSGQCLTASPLIFGSCICQPLTCVLAHTLLLPWCFPGRETPPARPPFSAAPPGAADHNLSAGERASARAGFPGICLDTYLGILSPAWEGGRKYFHILLLYVRCKKRKGKTDLGCSPNSSFMPQ